MPILLTILAFFDQCISSSEVKQDTCYQITISDDGKDGLDHTEGAADGASVNIYGKGELLSSVWDYGGYYIVYWRNGELVEQSACLG